ncbi:MAG: hemerythrin domain-containing protein [Hyphomonadaceae bacterium]
MAVTHPNTGARSDTEYGADAIKMLKTEHREANALFKDFSKTTSGPRKQKLAKQVCAALRIHMQIEEEIFYRACREAGVDTDIMDEGDVEHESARKLIKEIEAGKAGDDHWDAKVKVLGEMVRHHVREEEEIGGMFWKARRADIDLDELGVEMQARKDQLLKQLKRRQ